MAINYQSSFNSGELSGRMGGRSDLEVYRNGCSRLENFFVLPQGGVERRTGTEFIAKTNDGAGTARAKMIPFIFSSTQNYAVEIGDGYIDVWDGDTRIAVTSSSPYTDADLDDLEFVQRFDILFIQSPNQNIYLLKRTSLTPTFEIEEIEYDYPPLLDLNDSDISITPSDVTGDITLTASDDFFDTGHDGAYFTLEYDRGTAESLEQTIGGPNNPSNSLDVSNQFWGATIVATKASAKLQTNTSGAGWVDVPGQSITNGTLSYVSPTVAAANVLARMFVVSGTAGVSIYTDGASSISGFFNSSNTTAQLDVSYSSWNVKTGGTSWLGRVIVQRKVGEGVWEDFLILGDTTDINFQNFSYTSPGNETADTFIRIKYSADNADDFKYNIYAESPYQTGLVRVTAYNSPTSVDATVISNLGSASETLRWTEGAFSDFRGWPRSIAFHEDRLWLAGSDNEPSTIYGSVSGDYFNFLPDTLSSGGIRRIPDNPELAQWLVGRDRMILGTEGGAIVVKSVDDRELIDASNIVTAGQAVFGASSIPAIAANDVIVYAERSNKKIRELIFSDEEGNFRSADMNIMNDEILGNGIKELFLQQQPDQIIWSVKEDGTMAHLTYERVQEVVGWGRFVTNGQVQSACRIPSGGSEDEIWMCVNRGGVYTIERTKSRSDGNWFLDSAVDAITGLDHLEGLEVGCVVDGEYDGTYTVSGGAITPTVGASYLVGLEYDSILRTMPIEPSLMNRLPNSRVKGAVKAIAEFYPTRGGSIREKGKTGELIDSAEELSGEKKFPIASDWTREKVVEIKQHLPYPMVVLSVAVWTEAKGA